MLELVRMAHVLAGGNMPPGLEPQPPPLEIASADFQPSAEPGDQVGHGSAGLDQQGPAVI